jgi:RimJ/RimL family protein N-acetyltransferase
MFPSKYKVLKNNFIENGKFSLVPIRYNDRLDIMRWRNEQIFHLRQQKPLTEEDQNSYFDNVVSKLFEEDKPRQILFSYLEDGKCIGYGGLVHINWVDKNAEISFIMDSALESTSFHDYWRIYLNLLEQVAFHEISLHKIYTYAFDLRPHLYEAIEAVGYTKEAVLKEHCLFNEEYKDVIIHSKRNDVIVLREASIKDKQLIFEWVNDEETRKNSFNNSKIDFSEHSKWYESKIKNEEYFFYIGEVENRPIGLVRFERKESEAVIGVLLDKNFRGKGIAPILIKKACDIFKSNNLSDISAYIKEENVASIKSFKKAGFVFHAKQLVNGIEAQIHKLIL